MSPTILLEVLAQTGAIACYRPIATASMPVPGLLAAIDSFSWHGLLDFPDALLSEARVLRRAGLVVQVGASISDGSGAPVAEGILTLYKPQ